MITKKIFNHIMNRKLGVGCQIHIGKIRKKQEDSEHLIKNQYPKFKNSQCKQYEVFLKEFI